MSDYSFPPTFFFYFVFPQFVCVFVGLMKSKQVTEWNREKINDLIESYEALPELWCVTDRRYRDKNLKKDAWRSLAERMCCSEQEVQQKINTVRAQFTREVKKVKESINSGSELYVPKWFGYQKLLFLRDVSRERRSKVLDTQIPIEIEETRSEEDYSVVNIDAASEASLDLTPPPCMPPKKKERVEMREMNLEDEIYQEPYQPMPVREPSSHEPDEFAIYGMHVANELRKIRGDFALQYAKMKINTVLFEATTGAYNQMRPSSTVDAIYSSTSHCRPDD